MGPTPPLHYARTSDDVSIAHARWGDGPCFIHLPAVLTGNDLRDFAATPNGGRWIARLADHLMLVMYDSRGCGASSRGVGDYSIDGLMKDIDAVAAANGANQVHLFGSNHAGPLAIAYAATRPDRVRSLTLWSTALGGPSFQESAPAKARRALQSIGQDIRMEFIRRTIVGLDPDGRHDWDHVQRCRSEEALRALSSTPGWADLDAHPFVAHVRAPTLVVHPSDVLLNPLAWGQEIAALIPNARLLVIPSNVQPPYAQANAEFLANSLVSFVHDVERGATATAPPPDTTPPSAAGLSSLTPREFEILRLVAAGWSNPRIAAALSISTATVARHMTHVLRKVGCTNRVEAARWAFERGVTDIPPSDS